MACEQKNVQILQEHDRRFHSTMVELYGERRLYKIWHSMFTWMIFRYGRHADLMDSYHEHKAILEAIKHGDKEKAIQLLKENIQ